MMRHLRREGAEGPPRLMRLRGWRQCTGGRAPAPTRSTGSSPTCARRISRGHLCHPRDPTRRPGGCPDGRVKRARGAGAYASPSSPGKAPRPVLQPVPVSTTSSSRARSTCLRWTVHHRLVDRLSSLGGRNRRASSRRTWLHAKGVDPLRDPGGRASAGLRSRDLPRPSDCPTK